MLVEDHCFDSTVDKSQMIYFKTVWNWYDIVYELTHNFSTTMTPKSGGQFTNTCQIKSSFEIIAFYFYKYLSCLKKMHDTAWTHSTLCHAFQPGDHSFDLSSYPVTYPNLIIPFLGAVIRQECASKALIKSTARMGYLCREVCLTIIHDYQL